MTQILTAIERGDPRAPQELLPIVYNELRRLAALRLANENSGQSIDATGLVHEAYLRLVGSGAQPDWNSSRHFFAAAAEAMRRILVERARRKRRYKHGGDRVRVDLDAVAPLIQETGEDLLALDVALERLAAEDPVKAEVVKLRFFGGMTMPEIAKAMKVSLATTERHWAYARTWLYVELSSPNRK